MGIEIKYPLEYASSGGYWVYFVTPAPGVPTKAT